MGTEGDENLDKEPDIEPLNKSKIFLSDLSSHDLIERWRSGCQDAASILWARYEVRLVALVAARLNRRFGEVAAEDIVQSAFGSFFRVARGNSWTKISLESSATAWNILATFSRRKLARVIERRAAAKRGRDWRQNSLELIEDAIPAHPSPHEVAEVLEDLNSLLTPEQSRLVNLLLEEASQKEIAERLNVDERTVRRRIASIRNTIEERNREDEAQESEIESKIASISLPHIPYSEFVLGKMVGRGASGKVYKAVLQASDETVAVKFMHRFLWSNPANKQLYLQEVQHASRISHPGIVKYHGWGQSPHGGPYIVSQYVDGHSLTNTPHPSLDCAVQWLIQVCKAIEAAHRAGVVHGDLTPNNILVANNDRIVLTDFGFAAKLPEQVIDSQTPLNLSPRGGTLGFAAPEQISNAFGQIGPATDIYAIGGLAYYFLQSRGPHDCKENSLIDTVFDGDVTIPKSCKTPAGDKLAAVANLALKKAVDLRPKTVSELVVLLSQ